MSLAVRTLGYIGSHWRGEQSLARSFWVNLVLLRTVLFVLQRRLQPGDGEDYAEQSVLVGVIAVFAHGVVFAWQVVGAVRAAEVDMVGSGSQASTWGVQLGCVALFFLTFAYSVDTWRMTRSIPAEERLHERLERERRERYALTLDASATALLLRGTIEGGVTRRVETLLRQTPTIERLVLESAGGNVHEARGLARVQREHALASHVDGLCASACTVAFVGGSPRSMSETARFGFHQYRFAGGRATIVGDPARAQRRDQAMFLDAGVDPSFVKRMFRRTPDDMWWPAPAELEAAGLVDRVTRAAE